MDVLQERSLNQQADDLEPTRSTKKVTWWQSVIVTVISQQLRKLAVCLSGVWYRDMKAG